MEVKETTNGAGDNAVSVPAVIHQQPAIVPRPAQHHMMPVISVQEMVQRRSIIAQLVKELLVEGVDYGTLPGTNQKPFLMKPGAEKMISVFGLEPRLDHAKEVVDWTGEGHGGEPFFCYEYQFSLLRDGRVMGVGIGSANSWESKYRYRWVADAELPPQYASIKHSLKSRDDSEWVFKFALEKGETSGAYGKPPEYWQKFHDAIANGEATTAMKATKSGRELAAIVIPAKSFRIPNPDIADIVNTLQKMGQKRAYIQATLMALGLSEFFTQDVEDFLPTTFTRDDAPIQPAATSDAGRAPEQPKPAPTPPKPEPPKAQAPPPDAYGEIPTRKAAEQPKPAAEPNKGMGLADYKNIVAAALANLGVQGDPAGKILNAYLRAYIGLGERGAMPKDQAIYMEPMATLALMISADASVAKTLIETPAELAKALRAQVDGVANSEPEQPAPPPPTANGVEGIRAYICQARGFSDEDLTALLHQHGVGNRDYTEVEAYLRLLAYTNMARLAASDQWTVTRAVMEIEKELGQTIPFPPDSNIRGSLEVCLTNLTTQPNSPLLKA